MLTLIYLLTLRYQCTHPSPPAGHVSPVTLVHVLRSMHRSVLDTFILIYINNIRVSVQFYLEVFVKCA